MNGQTVEKLNEPWKHRDKLPATRLSDVLLMGGALLASSLALLLATNEQASFFTLLVLTAFGVHGMRKSRDLLILLLAAFAASLLVGALGGASAFLGLVIGTGALAYLFTTSARPYAAAIPLAVAAVALAITKDPLPALLSLSVLPSGALLAIATLTHQRRTAAICASIGGLLISLGAILALLLFRACGSLELGTVSAYLEGLRDTLSETLILIRDEFLIYMEEALTAEGATAEEIARTLESLGTTMSDEILRETVSVLYSVLPALAVVLCSIVSFEAQLLLSHYYFHNGWRSVLTADSTVFSMSVSSAVIYLVTFVCTVFLGASSLIGAAMQNLCLMLLPGLCVAGVGAVLGMFRNSKGGARIFLSFILLSLFCCAGFSGLYFLALWGAYSTVLSAIGKRVMEKLHRSDDGDSDGEGKD